MSSKYFISSPGIEVNICYEDYVKQTNQFDCFKGKQFCEFISQTIILDEDRIYDYTNRFENIDLDCALAGAQLLSEICKDYEEKVQELIKGVNENVGK